MDPATIVAWLVAKFVDNCLGNVVSAEINTAGHFVARHIVERTLRAIDGDPDERANHDIARTVRLAQMTALETVLDGYARLNAPINPSGERASVAFETAAASFCREQRKRAKTHPEALALPSVERLQEAADGLLVASPSGSEARDYSDLLRESAETLVLAELGVGCESEPPADFAAYFKAGAKGGHPSFLAAFTDEIREAVKSNPRYRDILLVSGLAEIKAQGFETHNVLRRLEQRFGIAADDLGAGMDRIDQRTERMEPMLNDVSAMVKRLLANSEASRQPGPTPDLAGTVESIAEGASEGDTRLAAALERLKAGDSEGAAPLLRVFAEDKRARIGRDSREAATAYRNLGAIAGLRDPKAAFEAYAMAADFDPDDHESALWTGWLAIERGALTVAEPWLRQVMRSVDDDHEWHRWASIGIGDVQSARGDLMAALTSYQAALAVAERLAAADPGNAGWQHDLAVSHDRIGEVRQAQGDLAAALTSHQAALAIAERLAAADTGNAGWQRALAVSHDRIGDVRRAQGDLAAALTSYHASLAIKERLAAADPGNAGWQHDLSVSHDRIGDVRQAQGDLAAALTSYRASLAIRERLATADPGNAGWQHGLAVSHDRIGDVRRAQGDLAAALTSYRAALAIRERLGAADPGNAGWQHDLAVSHDRIGAVRQAQGDLAAALTSYRASLAIRERLATADPGNAGWQHGLAVSHDRIGDVRRAQGDLAAALTSYRAALAIRERLGAADPGNAGWQHDLAVSHDRIGAVRQAQGDLAAALTSYRAALAIAERLATADPGNAGWQHDLAISLGGVGTVERRRGRRDESLPLLARGRAVIARLQERSPDYQRLAADLAWFDAEIARLQE